MSKKKKGTCDGHGVDRMLARASPLQKFAGACVLCLLVGVAIGRTVRVFVVSVYGRSRVPCVVLACSLYPCMIGRRYASSLYDR